MGLRAGVQVSINSTSPWRTLGGWPSSQEMVTMVTNSPFWEWKHPHSPTTATDVIWPAHSGSKPAVHHWRPVKIPDLSRTLCSPGRVNMVRVFGTQPSEPQSLRGSETQQSQSSESQLCLSTCRISGRYFTCALTSPLTRTEMTRPASRWNLSPM